MHCTDEMDFVLNHAPGAGSIARPVEWVTVQRATTVTRERWGSFRHNAPIVVVLFAKLKHEDEMPKCPRCSVTSNGGYCIAVGGKWQKV